MTNEYGAITIDTSIFKSQGMKLDSLLFKSLYQFKDSTLKIIISDIILNEVKKHLINHSKEIYNELNKKLKDYKRYFPTEVDFDDFTNRYLAVDNSQVVSTDKIHDFIRNTGATIISSDEYLDINLLIESYFNSAPPFSDSGSKKNEFPDAIALLAIEKWAEDNNRKIIAISKDNDWLNYADSSEWIDVSDDLPSIIANLQLQINPEIILSFISHKLSDESDIKTELDTYVKDTLDYLTPYAEAESGFSYDYDSVELIFESLSIIENENGALDIKLIDYKEDSIVVKINTNINAKAYCNFHFSVMDSIDKDYVSIGYSSAESDLEFDSEILVTFSGDFKNVNAITDIAIEEIQLLKNLKSINFGFIEPDLDIYDDE